MVNGIYYLSHSFSLPKSPFCLGRDNLRHLPLQQPYQRKPSGHSVIELGAMTMCMLVMTLLCVDAGIMVIATSVNDRACRNAARAAAQMGTAASAQNAAIASLRLCRVDGYFVSQPTFSSPSFVYQDYGGDPTPDLSPYVSVTTSIVVRIPAPIFFFGARFGQGGTMTFTQTYTFPIIKTTIDLS